MWHFEKLLSKHLKCSSGDICRSNTPWYGMPLLHYNGNTYAVGKPGFTESHYGPEIKLSESISAYRIILPENNDQDEEI